MPRIDAKTKQLIFEKFTVTNHTHGSGHVRLDVAHFKHFEEEPRKCTRDAARRFHVSLVPFVRTLRRGGAGETRHDGLRGRRCVRREMPPLGLPARPLPLSSRTVSQPNVASARCTRTSSAGDRGPRPAPARAPAPRAHAPLAMSPHSERISSTHKAVNDNGQNIVMYSDELGKSMGSQLGRRFDDG
ncbi:hypothetical protein EVAR_29748_1 [Eumeta japonica]|uniref:Uncharacterized protein n=1 Tax=Eumeta variegata TaxID=151549 RepID=A0A4C1WTR6_EUMVA|nr:hypothetical protein EVAR_29748_1 [Eumeta japonica]